MTPLQTEFYARIGKTLLEVQLAERQIQVCLSYFLPLNEAQSVEEIEALAAAHRKDTLGRLIIYMRDRIVIATDFDDKLTKFVEDRNALAHRFLAIDGVALSTDDGLKKGIEFLKKLSAQALDIRSTIQGLMRAIDDAPASDDAEEKRYTDLAKVVFGGQQTAVPTSPSAR
jgi:hypothetical protein